MSCWILHHRRVLTILWFVLALVCVAEVISLRSIGQLVFDPSSLGLLLALPFFLLGIVHLALMYGNWFQVTAASGAISKLKRGFFWTLLLAFVAVLILFLRYFGLQAQ